MLRNFNFALKVLWKDRGFALITFLTLAVCIGANASIFTVVQSVLLQPLPIPESNRILLMANQYPNVGIGGGLSRNSGVPDYYDRLRDVRVFEEQAMYNFIGHALDVNGNAERIRGMGVTPSFFRLLRVPPRTAGRSMRMKVRWVMNKRSS
jgi:putative ABC transport system permease protein